MALFSLTEWSGDPEGIGSDNGPEYISKSLVALAIQKVLSSCLSIRAMAKNPYARCDKREVRNDWLNHNFVC